MALGRWKEQSIVPGPNETKLIQIGTKQVTDGSGTAVGSETTVLIYRR